MTLVWLCFFAFIAWRRILGSEAYPASVPVRLKWAHAAILIMVAMWTSPVLRFLGWLLSSPRHLFGRLELQGAESGGPLWAVLNVVWVLSGVLLLACCYLLARRRYAALKPFYLSWTLFLIVDVLRAIPRQFDQVRPMVIFIGVTFFIAIYATVIWFYRSRPVIRQLFGKFGPPS